MDYLQNLLDGSTIPAVTALLLGLVTALSPCPLATNIAAIGYVSRDISDRRKVFFKGLAYMAGRTFSYTVLGIVLMAIIGKGGDTFGLQSFIAEYGERIIGPAMIIIGVLMLFADKLRLPSVAAGNGKVQGIARRGYWGAFLLGCLFAMAFCPTSGVLYFGALIPMSVASSAGWLLIVEYAIATAIPVMVVAWFIAFSMGKIGSVYDRMKTLQRWLNAIVGVLFIIIGLYYCYIAYI